MWFVLRVACCLPVVTACCWHACGTACELTRRVGIAVLCRASLTQGGGSRLAACTIWFDCDKQGVRLVFSNMWSSLWRIMCDNLPCHSFYISGTCLLRWQCQQAMYVCRQNTHGLGRHVGLDSGTWMLHKQPNRACADSSHCGRVCVCFDLTMVHVHAMLLPLRHVPAARLQSFEDCNRQASISTNAGGALDDSMCFNSGKLCTYTPCITCALLFQLHAARWLALAMACSIMFSQACALHAIQLTTSMTSGRCSACAVLFMTICIDMPHEYHAVHACSMLPNHE